MAKQSKRIFVSSAGVVAGPFFLEDALSYMRSIDKPSIALDLDLVIYAAHGPVDMDNIQMRNDSLIDRIRLEAFARA